MRGDSSPLRRGRRLRRGVGRNGRVLRRALVLVGGGGGGGRGRRGACRRLGGGRGGRCVMFRRAGRGRCILRRGILRRRVLRRLLCRVLLLLLCRGLGRRLPGDGVVGDDAGLVAG